MAVGPVTIANCGGFWGDDPSAALRQVEGGHIDYLVMDYLSEVAMAILQKARARRPDAGYAPDVLVQLRDVLPQCLERGVRIITNAGGVNPLACRAAVERLADELGVADRLKVAVLLGDDLFPELDTLLASGEPLRHMDTGRPLSDIRDRVLSANAYIGAAPIVEALAAGANVVIAGRVTDAAVTLAPMMHEFGWAADDWDRLAAGVVAGHIVECGTQCTGGNFTDWRLVPTFSRMGFPIVEAHPDGSVVVTKHPGSGGLVSVHTVVEQLVYEIGSPAYASPDVVARFDTVRVTQDGPDRVRVTGARGEPAPETLKVSVNFKGGWRAFGRLALSGPDVLAKAQCVAEAFWECAGGKALYEEASDCVIGWNGFHPPLGVEEPSEAILQFAVRDQDESKINARFGRQLVPRVLGTVPGITYVADQGRPRATEVIGYWPALVSRTRVTPRVIVDTRELAVPHPSPTARSEATVRQVAVPTVSFASSSPRVRVPLSALCLARSGDKGDTANVGVIARSEAIYHWMIEHVTVGFVKERFAGQCHGDVQRFLMPNVLAANFLLLKSLGGGGTLSLLLDAQAKALAQYLLAAEVDVAAALLDTVPGRAVSQATSTR